MLITVASIRLVGRRVGWLKSFLWLDETADSHKRCETYRAPVQVHHLHKDEMLAKLLEDPKTIYVSPEQNEE